MRQSLKFMQASAIAVLSAAAVMTLGIDDAFAQAADFGTMAKTGILKQQTGGAASLVKQGTVVLGAAFGVGGVSSLYSKAKAGFKDGAKDVFVPGVMIVASGLAFGANALTNSIVRKSTGTETETQITDTTGGTVTW